MHHQIAYFLESWMGRGLGLEGQLVGGDRPDISAPRRNLPEHQAARVHVDAEEGVAGEIDGSLEHLGGHISSGAHLQYLRDIYIMQNTMVLGMAIN